MNKMQTIQSNHVEETKQFAAMLAKHMDKGMLITLEGDLGAGKTAFVQGFAKGLNIEDRVKSPTFNILKIYTSGKMPLYHMDVYRLEDSEQEEGLEEYIETDGIAIIEWAQFIENDLPKEKLAITITFTGEHTRTIQLDPIGKRYEQLIHQVTKQWGEQNDYINN